MLHTSLALTGLAGQLDRLNLINQFCTKKIYFGIWLIPEHCINFFWWFCLRCWRVSFEFGWGLFKWASWSFIIHFRVHMYFSKLVSGSFCFVFFWVVLAFYETSFWSVFDSFWWMDWISMWALFCWRFSIFRWSGLYFSGRFCAYFSFNFFTGFLFIYFFTFNWIWVSVWWILAKCSFLLLLKLWPIILFQLDQLLHKNSVYLITLSDYVHPPCISGISVLSHIGPHYSPSFKKGQISFVFHL